MSGKLSHVLHAVYCEPWLIRPEMHARIREIVEAHVTGQAHVPGGIIEALAQAAPTTRPEPFRMIQDVAVVGLSGVIGKRVGALEKSSGVTDVDDAAEALDMAAADQHVRGIVLHVDSPGGTVTGVPELAEKVRSLRSVKPIIGYTDTQAASAGYWVISQASAIVSTPSAVTGSVGVYLPVLDQAARFEAAGLKQEVIKAGRFKGAGIPGTRLTDDQRAMLQDRVNVLHGMFRASVREARPGPVSDDVMEGQTFFGAEAVAAGLVDVVSDFSDAVEMARGLSVA